MQHGWVFVFSVFIFLYSHFSYAERIVLKNPSPIALLSQKNFKEVKRFELGENLYVVLDTQSLNSGLKNLHTFKELLEAEDAFLDARIELIRANETETTAKNAWHIEALQYDKLPKMYDGKGIVVAVIDTGLNYKHPALESKMWVNPGEIPGNKIDDDKNGYVDDVYGYDFVDEDDSDPMDGGVEMSHGTHCAGIIASLKDPETNAQGVAPGVKLMAVRIISGAAENFLTDAVEAIKYAVDNGAHILSNSWRIYQSWEGFYSEKGKTLLRDAIIYAEKRNVIFVAAAGNENNDNDQNLEGSSNEVIPAGYKGLSNMVVVAASKQNTKPSSFTNYGKISVTVAAPGSAIISTYGENGWKSMSGTSMAAPIVSGILARGLSAGMSSKEAIDQLKRTSNQNAEWEQKTISGLIDALRFFGD